MKIAKACQQCRTGKRRCQRLGGQIAPRAACAPCEKRNIPCSYSLHATDKTKTLAPARDHDDASLYPNEPEAARGQSLVPDLASEDVAELVGHYLYFIHDKPHSLFHGPTLRKAIARDQVSKALLYAVCALGTRFSKAEHLRFLGPSLTDRSRELFQSDLINVSLENIQTCVLLANICAADLETGVEALYFGIAIRMAQIMGLHQSSPDDSFIIAETKARVWWTLFMADRWCSAGLGLPRQIHDSKRGVSLPIDEHVFQAMAHDRGQNDQRPLSLGLWAYMITLVEIFGPVQDLNRLLVEDNIRDEESDRRVDLYSQQLNDWQESLPPHLQLTEANLDQHKDRGLGGSFVALHLGYHHYATLLFFQYLDPRRASLTTHQDYLNRCKYHASAYSALLKASRDREACEAVYATVGHMTLVSSSVLLHTLLFGKEDELLAARQNLTHNFEALIELKRLWPSLERTLNRLFAFQNSCLSSMDTHTHKIDRWMVRFLLEHALPLDEKLPTFETSPTPARFVALLADGNQLSLRKRAMDSTYSIASM